MGTDKQDIWNRLAEPVSQDAIAWRQDGKPVARNGKFYARFVCYVEANTVRERLDSVVPGEWDLTLELLPPIPGMGEDSDQSCSFKARLQILGVIREDVGTGKDYKSAATDAFKRAGVRFGIAHELYSYEQNWVLVDSDSRYAKPLIDPGLAYVQRHSGSGSGSTSGSSSAAPVEREPASAYEQETSADPTPKRASSARSSAGSTSTSSPDTSVPNDNAIICPKCGGKMWDNRLSKRNPKAPDFKCRDRSCDGVIWPARPGQSTKPVEPEGPAFHGDPGDDEIPGHNTLDSSPLGMSLDDIPF